MADRPERTSLLTVNKETLVPLGLLVAVVVTAITVTTWLQKTLLNLEHKIDQLDVRVSLINESDRSRWSSADQAAWAELLQARNPALNVPPTKRN